MIDVRAFSLGLVLTVAMAFILLLIVISRLDRERGFWALQAGSLAGLCGVLLVTLQCYVSPFLAFAGGNGLSLLSLVLFAHGLSLWITQRPVHRSAWLAPVLMMLLSYWYGVQNQEIGPRILSFNALFFILTTGLGIFLWRQAARSALSRPLRWLALTAFWLSAMAMLRFLVWLLLGIPEQSILDPAWQHVLPYFGQLIGLMVFVVLIAALVVSHLVERLRRQASLDPRTQLLNRQGLRERLDAWLHGAPPPQTSCALMMLDLDHFKRINDSHGHDIGDLVLRRLADVMRLHAGPDDFPVRLGGEEFALLSFNNEPAAQAEAIRRSFAEWPDELPKCTVSIGLVPETGLSADQIREAFKLADAALYQAKSKGRNRVESLAA